MIECNINKLHLFIKLLASKKESADEREEFAGSYQYNQ